MYALHDTRATVPAWNPQQLTDAVPLRLHQLIDFDLVRDAGPARSANAEPRRPLRNARYAAARSLPMFAVR
ncbi:hypothetical protein ABU614_03015 [Lysobacter firmicutimachus]|uniref:Uncharacterized protein n=1 Tax=Lysobacter firmicutimachus TaxID=1792846 RepID=A0AAU8MUA7_9GAMM